MLSNKQINMLECLFLLIPIFRPIILEYFTSSIHFFSLYTYFALAYLLIHILTSKKYKYTLKNCDITLYAIAILFSSVINSGNYNEEFDFLINSFLCVSICIIYSDKFDILIRSLMIVSEICVYSNLISIVIFPNGLYTRSVSGYSSTTEWILGVTNYFIQWMIPSIIIAWIYCYFEKRWLRTLLLSSAIVITEILKGSGTCVTGIVLFLGLMLIPFADLIFTPIRSVVIATTMLIIILFFRTIDFFKPLILFLGKDMTFSNRTFIWDNALDSITGAPILGHGLLDNDSMVSYLGSMPSGIRWEGATHCHNQFLQIIFQGGFVAFLLFLCVIVMIIRKARLNWPAGSSKIAVYAVATYIIIGITEVFSYPLMTFIFPLLYLYLCVEEKEIIK